MTRVTRRRFSREPVRSIGASARSDDQNSNGRTAFHPEPVTTFEEAGLDYAMVESLVLKFLLNLGTASGRRIAAELGLPFGPFPEFLRQLKNQQIVNYASTSTASDFVYTLTDRAGPGPRPTSRSALMWERLPCRSRIT